MANIEMSEGQKKIREAFTENLITSRQPRKPRDGIANKPEIISRLREKGYTKADAEIVYYDVINTITEVLASGVGVAVQGFGVFEVVQHEPRKVRNPITGETWVKEASVYPRFKPSSVLKNSVAAGYMTTKSATED